MTYTYPVEEYKKQLLAYEELEKLTFTPEDGRELVIKKLEERSAQKRRIAETVNTMISEYIERFEKSPELLGEEDAAKLEEFYAGLTDPKTGRELDLGIGVRITGILKEYYRRKGSMHDYLRTLQECVVEERILSYNHTSGSCESPYIAECNELSARFEELSEEDRIRFFVIYYWVFLNHEDDRVADEKPHPVEHILAVDDFFTERLGDRFYEYLEKVDSVGLARNTLSQMLEHFLWNARHHRKPDMERIRPKLERYTAILHEKTDAGAAKSESLKLSVQSTLLHADFQLGKITIEELLDTLSRIQADVKEGESPSIQASRLGKINYHYLLFLYRFSGYDKEKVMRLSQQRIKETLPRILKITREVNNSRFNMYLMLFILGASFTSRFESFSNLLLEMTVYSDKALYIHTEMVKEISLVLFDHLIKTDPGFFEGVAGRGTEYIQNHRDEMRRLLAECCMFHDIGKFFMLDIVENSMRRLTDGEFAIIRTHPSGFEEFGRDWVEQDENLQCIRDCALTHHLWHNGERGYPAVSHTKNRPFADILAIADSIDAATDYIGRPYHSGKTLLQLLDEIRGEAGTRYGPGAAAALSSPEVQEKLLYLTTEGRKDINYRIYAFNKA
ncbi:MAG: hypothetical protein IK047_00395 [Clostridia bacterium]|nr:hypothetical protein [Clostridia bacterium]